MQKKELLPILLIAVMFAMAFYYYPLFPERIPSHWNINGEIDSYSGKNVLFIIPAVTLFIYLLFYFLPYLEPFKANLNQFYRRFGFWMKTLIVLFFFTLYAATIVQTLGYTFNIIYIIFPAIAALFLFFGYTMKFVKRNYFIGIRTPWTLNSDIIWDKTHKLAGRLFTIAAVLLLTGLFLPKQLLWLFFALIIAIALIPTTYSLYLFKKK